MHTLFILTQLLHLSPTETEVSDLSDSYATNKRTSLSKKDLIRKYSDTSSKMEPVYDGNVPTTSFSQQRPVSRHSRHSPDFSGQSPTKTPNMRSNLIVRPETPINTFHLSPPTNVGSGSAPSMPATLVPTPSYYFPSQQQAQSPTYFLTYDQGMMPNYPTLLSTASQPHSTAPLISFYPQNGFMQPQSGNYAGYPYTSLPSVLSMTPYPFSPLQTTQPQPMMTTAYTPNGPQPQPQPQPQTSTPSTTTANNPVGGQSQLRHSNSMGGQQWSNTITNRASSEDGQKQLQDLFGSAWNGRRK